MPTISRTNIRVRRSDGREFPTILFAYRQLLGTPTELGYSEHQRIRHELRRGRTAQDRHGFTWSSVGEVLLYSSVEAALAATTGSCQWSDLTYGVEIECKHTGLSNYDIARKLSEHGFGNWRVKPDGSIGNNGHEVISPVLKGQEGLDALRKVMDLVKEMGCWVDAACGLHVHIGIRDLEMKALRNMSMQFLGMEQHFDAIVQRSRRGSANHFCKSNTQLVDSDAGARINDARTAQQVARVMNGGWQVATRSMYRYYKMNFQSFAIHGTVEFRQHGGTVESKKACSWVRLITGFVAHAANAAEITERRAMSFDELVQMTDEDGQRFFRARREYFQRLDGRAATAA